MDWKGSEHLFAGLHKDDDAVIVKMPDGRLQAATVDVFTPVVDDPYTYGQVAAANSLSDIYAMGGTPRFALAILGYPPTMFGPETPHRIIQGAIDKSWEAGVVLGGGHTIKTSEVIFGLSVIGDFPTGKVLEKGGAKPGDHLVITKPLGIGILTTAIKRQLLSPEQQLSVIKRMTELNAIAAQAAVIAGASACTDITGFGLLGHLLEMVTASGTGVTFDGPTVPILDGARELARQGVIPGGSHANLKHVAPSTDFAASLPEELPIVLADAQTSGGLLVALSDSALAIFKAECKRTGQYHVVIGEFTSGPIRILVR
jgi:selenide, water dikinase